MFPFIQLIKGNFTECPIRTPFISYEFAFVHAWQFQINLKERPVVMFAPL